MERRSARPSRADVRRSTPVTTTRRRFWNYPRPGYRGLHRWLPSWRFVVLSTVTVIGLIAGLGAAAYSSVEIPAYGADIHDQTTTVYFADPARSDDPNAHGEKMGEYPGVKRDIIECGDIPQHVKDAVVASEDRSFWTNSGVDPRGIARALYNNLKGGNQQGASTLTQQYVENYYGGTRHGYLGKAQEALLAVKINQKQSKDEIICNYLNTIYWGRGKTYGIQAAAQTYFGKDAKDLDVSEAALLAGIIPSPINWDPVDNPEKAKQRWNRTLDYMVSDPNLKTHLTAAQRAELTFPQALPYEPEPVYAGPNGYLMEQARQEAAVLIGVDENELMRGGYTIVTTIDKSMQDMAVESGRRLVDGELSGGATPSLCDPDEDPTCPGTLRVAMVTLDPADGSVRALYSGQDFIEDQYNRVTRGRVQAGSTFKPFTLVAALEEGKSLSSVYSGASPRTFSLPGSKDWKVINFGNSSYGGMNLLKATADSVNTVYAELNIEIGPEKTAAAAKTAGVTAPAGTELSSAPSNVLGPDAVRPIDMAQAYGVFAEQGLKTTPHIVARVIGPDNQTWDADTRATRVFDADVMADTVTALQGPVESGSAKSYVGPIQHHIAGKTGTSSDNKSAWFVGFTTDVVTAVALSQEGPGGSEVSITRWGGVSEVTGGSWPAALWADYMAGCGGKKSASACQGGVLSLAPYSKDTAFPPAKNVGKTSTPSPTETLTDEPTETAEAPPDTVAVPALANKQEADANSVLTGLGFQPNVVSETSTTVAKGRVIRVEPAAGTSLPYGDTVTIVVSTGPPAALPPDPENPGGGGGGNRGGP